MRWAKWTLLWIGAACSGCFVHTSVEASATVGETCSETATPDLWFGLVTHSAQGPQQNAFDDPLHTGDRVALIVHLPQPMHLYLVNAPDGEDPRLVHESERAVHGTVRIPEQGWFELAPPAGHELLALVATREPVDLDGAGGYWLMEEVAHTSTRDDLTLIQSAQPPGFTNAGAKGGHASIGVRGEGLKLRKNGSVSLDPRGHDEVVLLVDLDHRPSS